MKFMETYKRLERLCGEMLGEERPISAYIEEMKRKPEGASFVKGWGHDLKKLDHYRWVRNQISHNPACDEDNMCNAADVQWIEDFYQRLLNQTDPLALYCTAKEMRTETVFAPKKTETKDIYNENPTKTDLFMITIICLLAGIAAVCVYLCFFILQFAA